jgi:hypothetical protein
MLNKSETNLFNIIKKYHIYKLALFLQAFKKFSLLKQIKNLSLNNERLKSERMQAIFK